MLRRLREEVVRIGRFFRGRKRLERDFEDELAFHVAMREGEHERAGVERQSAVREARRELGGLEKWKEALRDVGRPRALKI